MPELPEVETIARGLAKRVSGDVIESLWLGEKPEPLKSSAHEIAAALQNTRILTVRRMGKHIVFDLARVGVERTLASTTSGQALSAKTREPKPTPKETKPPPPKAPPTAQFIVPPGMTGPPQVWEPKTEIAK